MKAWAYITTNKYNKVLYTGVTSNLKSRITNHKVKKYPNAFRQNTMLINSSTLKSSIV